MPGFRPAGCALVLAVLAPVMRADATVRYHNEIQAGIPLPGLDQALGGLRDVVIQIKGNKAYSSQGNLTSITDLNSQNVTVIDAAHRQFAIVPLSEYTVQAKNAMPAVPEQARAALASMKTNLESRVTGRTAAIQGIQAEEREFVMTVDMAIPGGPAAASRLLTMTMQMWTAKEGEADRVPALEEFRNYRNLANSAINSVELMKQITAALPGMGDNLTAMEEIAKQSGITLRLHMEMVMPVLAMMRQTPPQPGAPPLPAGFDPNAPLMQMNQEIVEFSTAQIDDATFQVPADYQRVSFDEVLKGAISAAAPPQFKP